MNSSGDNEGQFSTPENNMNLPKHDSPESISLEAGNYRALLAITRPLIIAKQTSRSLGVPICEDEAISLEAGDWRAEFTLRKGEIFCGDLPGGIMRREEGLAMTEKAEETSLAPEVEYDAAAEPISPLPQRGSGLKIRIHLGMS